MVKADVRRDYYADLGVSPSADTEEIKKQFRKLALRYHPDRNPGRESEYLAKFQAIQAAHEILGDPQQRLKYDTERLRAGYGKLYGPPQPSPLRRTNSSAQQSSTPTGTPGTTRSAPSKNPFSQRSSQGPAPSTGAQRYANYAKAAPTQPWEKVYGETRAEAFRGFQGLKPNSGMSGWSSFDPRTGKTDQATGRGTTSAAPPSARPRPTSAYEYLHRPRRDGPGPTRTTSTRRSGFAPGTPGGDEPMARNVSSYRSEHHQTRNSPSFFDTAPPPKPPRPPTDGLYESPNEEGHIPELERHRSRYAWSGGEKIQLSTDEARRSSRGRSRTNPPTPTSPIPDRHHSASPKLKADKRNGKLPSSTSSSDIDDDDDLLASATRPKATPKSRLRPNQKPSDFAPPKDWKFGTGEDFTDRSRLRAVFNTSRPHSYHEDMNRSTDDEYHKGHESDSTSFANRTRHRSPAVDAARESLYEAHFGTNRETSSFDNQTQESREKRYEQDPAELSADDLSESLKHGKFFASTSAYNEHATNSDTSSPHAPNMVNQSSDESSTRKPPPPFAAEKFSAETWSRRLEDKNWAMPAPERNKQQTNRRSERSPRKQSRAGTKVKPSPKPATVSSEQDEEASTLPQPASGGLGGTSAATPEAMELDDASVSKTNMQPPTSNSQKINERKKGSHLNLKELNDVRPLASNTSGGIDDLQDIQANLPFESRPNNINLSSHKPVQPRPLALPNPPKCPPQPAVIPLNDDPRTMVLPRKAWDRYVGELEAYMSEWNSFNRRMLAHFNTRQDAVETGLMPGWIRAVGDSSKLKINVTDSDSTTDGTSTLSSSDFSSTLSDDDDDVLVPGKQCGGYSAYVRGVEEDFRVRAHWDIAWEGHRICMLQLGQIKHWLRTTGKLGP